MGHWGAGGGPRPLSRQLVKESGSCFGFLVIGQAVHAAYLFAGGGGGRRGASRPAAHRGLEAVEGLLQQRRTVWWQKMSEW